MESNINFQKKNLFRNLIIKTCFILFLALITYISYVGFRKKYNPSFLNAFQYNQYKGNQELLGAPEKTGSYSYASNLGQCGLGQCVLNKENGLKRCPENITSKLTYNLTAEVCTNLETCDYDLIPYAVNTDGSATSKLCELDPDGERIPCRCTNKKTCKGHILSKFQVLSGETYGFQENYAPVQIQIGQVVDTDQNLLGYFNIKINDSSKEFCQINPSFTEEIINGCDFKNSIADKLGCEFIESINLTSTNTSSLKWRVGRQKDDFNSLPDTTTQGLTVSGDNNINPGNEYVILSTQNQDYVQWEEKNNDFNYELGDEGYIKFNSNDHNNIEIVKYTIASGTYVIEIGGVGPESGTQYRLILLRNIQSIYTNPVQTNKAVGTAGFAFIYDTDIEEAIQKTIMVKQDMTGSYCRFTNDSANYKNMLLCTREQNEVCNYGRLTYNIENLPNIGNQVTNQSDENFSRNFCQLNTILENPNYNYLDDPVKHTMACSVGPGCDGKNFQMPSPSGDISQDAIGRYFPEVDVDGIRGVWDISTEYFPVLTVPVDDQLINNYNINPGDYWSIKTVNETLLISKDYGMGISILEVEDLFGLNVFVNSDDDIDPQLAPSAQIKDFNYIITKVEYIYDEDKNENQSFVYIEETGLQQGVSVYQEIDLSPNNITEANTYGIVTREDPSNPSRSFYNININDPGPPNLVLKKLDGTSISPTTFNQGTLVNITLYKQFSFAGGNYGTKVMKNLANVNGLDIYGQFNRRLYTNEDNIPYTFKVTGSNDLTYPYPPQDLNQLDLNQLGIVDPVLNQSFGSISAPYKIPMSMYYPVWNAAIGKQECVRCKPFFLAYPVINFDDELENVIIQFSGKDFGNYEYNAEADNYCHVTTSKINFDTVNRVDITSRMIVLTEPNPSIQVGDFVLDSTLQLPFTVKPNFESEDNELDKLQIVPQIFPSDQAVKDLNAGTRNIIKNVANNVTPAPDIYPFSFGIEESDSENFSFNGVIKFPTQKGSISKEGGIYKFNRDPETNNYFFGKKYQSALIYNQTLMNKIDDIDGRIYTTGFYFIPTERVVSIEGNIVQLSSPYPYEILQPADSGDVLVQFCRMSNPLKLDVVSTTDAEGVTSYGNATVKINAMSDSRITDVVVTSKGSNFIQSNPPLIKLDLENQNFI